MLKYFKSFDTGGSDSASHIKAHRADDYLIKFGTPITFPLPYCASSKLLALIVF